MDSARSQGHKAWAVRQGTTLERIPLRSGHLVVVDFQRGEQEPLKGAREVGGVAVSSGKGQGFFGFALLQKAPQKAGQHRLALRQGLKAGVAAMRCATGLGPSCTSGHALCHTCKHSPRCVRLLCPASNPNKRMQICIRHS